MPTSIEFRGLSKKIFLNSFIFALFFIIIFLKLFWTVSGLFSVTDSTMLSVSESWLSKYVSTYFLGQDSLMASP